MNVLVAGANGKVGRQLVELLARGGHQARAMIRNTDQADTMRELGGEPVLGNLEEDVSEQVRGADAVIFTAGSGAHTGPDKTKAVDRDGALRMIETAEKEGVSRFLMVSSMGADDPDSGGEKMQPYLEAKRIADDRLQESGLTYTVVRPGMLTDDPATGNIEAGEGIGRGSITRADVARVLVAALDTPATYRRTFEILEGDVPIQAALEGL